MKKMFIFNKKYMISMKIYLYSIKYICIQSKFLLGTFNFMFNKNSHENIIFVRMFFVFCQCAINCVMGSSKKSCL